LKYTNYYEKRKLLLEGKLSLKENVLEFLNKIEINKHLNAFNFITPNILDKVELIENKIKNNQSGKLAGMVIAVKDNILHKDYPNTCSSKILSNYTAIYNATVIEKLLQEDAIIIGRTNCDEFAMGSSNENSYFGPVLNPFDNKKVPGGSSGGSAVAVAANLCDAALGSDTGGSIRQPAAFCGVFGIKPSYGLVSRYGLTAFASSFDSIGCFTNSIDDAALILEVIAGYDPKDSTSANINNLNFSDFNDSKIYKIGLPKEYFAKGLDVEIKERIDSFINKIKDKGHSVIDITLPYTEYSIATYYILTTAEASANLERFDGVRYGYRSAKSDNLSDMYINSRSEGFGDEVKRRIMLGTFVLSTGYYDAYYRKAQKVRKLIKNDFDKAFEKVDLILTPTTPTVAFNLGEKSTNPLEMYLSDIYTTSANLAGIPGFNIPLGKNSEGLPIGAQLMTKQFNEKDLFLFIKQIDEFLK
jgi:aspartyl-tRNA(Asn)/glutamyl-tRNA(Gln) amidotransferase subunit A